jgi:hypothetical protein
VFEVLGPIALPLSGYVELASHSHGVEGNGTDERTKEGIAAAGG